MTSGSIQPDDFLPVIASNYVPQGRTNVLALAHLHMKANWHPAPVHSFTLPLWYRGTYDEQQAARERAVIFDRSHLGRFYVTGAQATDVLRRIFATEPLRIAPKQIGRAIACREHGRILDIVTLCHLEEGRWLVITGPQGQNSVRAAVEAAVQPDEDVVVRDRLGESVLLTVVGPMAAQMLEAVVGPTIPGAVPDGEAHEILLGGYRALVAHDHELSEDGYWFVLSPEVGEHLWENSLTAGIEPAGLAAWDTMRLEAGAIEAPTETPPPATPYHAGLGALVDLSEDRPFPGSEALEHVHEVDRVLVGLRLDGPRLAKRASRITANGVEIGACVNAVYSGALGTGIALAYLPPGLARVEVDTDGVMQPADVVPLPFIAAARRNLGR